MSAESALHNAVAAAFTADTGSGGLNNSASSAYVRAWARQRDRNVGPDRTPNRPFVVSEVANQNISAAGAQNCRLSLRLHVFTARDQGFATADAVYDRLATVFVGTTITDPDGIWRFTPAANVSRTDGPSRTNEIHDIVDLMVLASTQ